MATACNGNNLHVITSYLPAYPAARKQPFEQTGCLRRHLLRVPGHEISPYFSNARPMDTGNVRLGQSDTFLERRQGHHEGVPRPNRLTDSICCTCRNLASALLFTSSARMRSASEDSNTWILFFNKAFSSINF